MIIENSGWSQERGWYCDKYEIDTTREDHEIHWRNGKVCKQLTPFESVERDWNCDGDVYAEFGAMFDGIYGREWHTPQGLLGIMLDGDAVIPSMKKI